MTETAKHTPGPWDIDSSRVHTSIEADGLHVAMVSYGNVTMETHLANARLIAAAPELLEVCEEFVRKCECGEARSQRSYAQMKAAIAKAKGE